MRYLTTVGWALGEGVQGVGRWCRWWWGLVEPDEDDEEQLRLRRQRKPRIAFPGLGMVHVCWWEELQGGL